MGDAALESRENLFEENSEKQTRWWLFTFPYESFEPFYLADSVAYARGQCEISPTGYWHWHVVVGFKRSQRFSYCKSLFGDGVRIECCRSRDNCLQYVWKDRTSLPFSRFEHGVKPVRRSSKRDWEETLNHAKEGNFDYIDPSVLIQHYGNLKKLRSDYMTPPVRHDIKLFIYWGVTGAGKSKRAYDEAIAEDGKFFKKQADTKWWCGYRGEKCVIFDEFTGDISLPSILAIINWMPHSVEVKGGSVPLMATHFWFTSNTKPERWWPHANERTWDAFKRRITIVEEFTESYSN